MAEAFKEPADLLIGDLLAALHDAGVPIQIIQNKYENCTIMNPEGGSIGKKSTQVSGVGNAVGGDNATVSGGTIDGSHIDVGSEVKAGKRKTFWGLITAIILALIPVGGKLAYEAYHHESASSQSAVAAPPSTTARPEPSLLAPASTVPPPVHP